MDYDTEVAKFQVYDSYNYHNIGGDDDTTLDPVVACEYANDSKMDCSAVDDEEEDGKDTTTDEPTNARSVKMEMFWSQVSVEQRFQEFQTLENWANGERITQLVDFRNIDTTPISFIHSMSDEICPVDMIEWVFS